MSEEESESSAPRAEFTSMRKIVRDLLGERLSDLVGATLGFLLPGALVAFLGVFASAVSGGGGILFPYLGLGAGFLITAGGGFLAVSLGARILPWVLTAWGVLLLSVLLGWVVSPL